MTDNESIYLQEVTTDDSIEQLLTSGGFEPLGWWQQPVKCCGYQPRRWKLIASTSVSLALVLLVGALLLVYVVAPAIVGGVYPCSSLLILRSCGKVNPRVSEFKVL